MMSQRLVVVLLLWLSVMMPLWAAERVALVIGNSAYQYAPRLHNPANDALGVSAALERLGFHVTRVNEADYNSLRRGLAEFRQHTRTAELALLYYAGHAIQVDGINYLVPVDAQITDPSDVSLHLVELDMALQQLQGAINVVILDACRDNPFAETLTQVAQSQNRSLGLGRGLGRVPMVSGGAYLMMAAAPGAVAQDGLPGGHSPYTAALLQHLETPNLDLRLLQAEIRSAVEQTTGGRQSPEAIDRLPPRPIYLAGGSVRTDEPAAPAHRGQLTITSQPSGAQLYLDGALLGIAPQTLSAPAQGREQVQIEARLEGYTHRQERVWLRAGQDSTLRLLLSALPAMPLGPSISRPATGQTIRDCPYCPEMVYIRGGSSTMGSPESEEGRDSDERQHFVKVADFYLAKYTVTVRDFRRFVQATNYRTEAERNVRWSGCRAFTGTQREWWAWRWGNNWRNPGFAQEDSHPVVCVSWNDTLAYIDWLNRESGQTYRLPTEAEWEYAARASTTMARYWGNNPNRACRYANGADREAKQRFPDLMIHECNDGYVYTAPVGRFQLNPWGLYDMLGNVWEWTCSVYDANYGGAEQRCAADNESGTPVARGGSWTSFPVELRSASRGRLAPNNRSSGLGFRLSRSL